MKKSLLILLFTCWALFFAAFRPVMPFAAETAAFPDGTPVTGGRILMGTIGEPSNLIPYMASDSASGEITGLLYVAPLKYDKDLNVVPWAAASYEVLEGGRLLRFVLRDDIRWEDGVPLTADDVEFTYKLMIDPKTPTAYSGDFLAIESFKKTGRLSFEVRYAKPFARSLMTWMGAILPKHVLEGQDIMTTPVARKPIGAGPYRLAKWDAGSMLTLTASDTYFEGRPNLDEVVYRIIPDPSTMFLELKAGKLDMMSLSPQQYLRQTQGPQWERDWRKYRYLSFSYTFLGFNLEHPFFKDVRVRRAISMAIDRQSLIDRMWTKPAGGWTRPAGKRIRTASLSGTASRSCLPSSSIRATIRASRRRSSSKASSRRWVSRCISARWNGPPSLRNLSIKGTSTPSSLPGRSPSIPTSMTYGTLHGPSPAG